MGQLLLFISKLVTAVSYSFAVRILFSTALFPLRIFKHRMVILKEISDIFKVVR